MEKHSIKFNNKQIVLFVVNKIILFFKKQRWHLIDVYFYSLRCTISKWYFEVNLR